MYKYILARFIRELEEMEEKKYKIPLADKVHVKMNRSVN
jgi:hypothetical protein